MEKKRLYFIEIVQEQEMNVCNDFLVIYCLRGFYDIRIGKNKYHLEKGGFLTILPYTWYEYRSIQDGVIAILHIKQELWEITDKERSLLTVRCFVPNTYSERGGEYDIIRSNYARVVRVYFENSPRQEYQVISAVSRLCEVLIACFADPQAVSVLKTGSETFVRCNRIMQYIYENWRQDISIEKLAQQEYVSSGYLSRFFKKNIGVTFSEYLTDLRLSHATKDLEYGADTVTQIALNNGFSNTNSFISYFKKEYGVTPNQYRNSLADKKQKTSVYTPDLPMDTGVSDLLEYDAVDDHTEQLINSTEERKISIQINGKTQKLTHNWRRVLNIGYARDGLLAEIQEQIRRAQAEIGYEYVRFHGILDDDMHVYYEDETGNPHIDCSRIDILIDSLLKMNLKPYIEIGYMPKSLAKGNVQPFERSSYVSTFNNEKNWIFLVRELVSHLIRRYGNSEVERWKFTTIGSNIVAANIISLDEYLRLYHVTYACVKELDPNISFGGPGGWTSSIRDGSTVDEIFMYCKEHNCVPDFICTLCFPHVSIIEDPDFWKYILSHAEAPSVLSNDIHYLKNILKDYKELLSRHHLEHLEIWIEEWNSTIWQRDLSGDTCYRAAWLVNNICENYDSAASFGYWTISDFFEECANFESVYHGGFGLFTYNGIPKSGWQALRLLKMLGNENVSSGEGWLVTQNANGIQIIMNNYCHYDNLYCLRYKKLTDPLKAYNVFCKNGRIKYRLKIDGLSEGTYEVREYLISKEHGSSFDEWLNMGMPSSMRMEEIEYLKQISQPQYKTHMAQIQDTYQIEAILDSHEVKMILLERI